jgi:hypothetical protein
MILQDAKVWYNSEYVTYQLTFDLCINSNDLIFRNTFVIRFDKYVVVGALEVPHPPSKFQSS